MTSENKIIATVSILIGLFVFYSSIDAFYTYFFTDIMCSYMRPLQELIIDVLFSSTAILGGLFIFLKNQKALTIYNSLGTGILVYNIIKFFLGQKEILDREGILVKLLVGTCLIIYFNSKYGLKDFNSIENKKSLKLGLTIGSLMAVLPVIFFHNYLYSQN